MTNTNRAKQKPEATASQSLVVDAPLAYPPDPIVIRPKPEPVEETHV